jgi:hypothetical protein
MIAAAASSCILAACTQTSLLELAACTKKEFNVQNAVEFKLEPSLRSDSGVDGNRDDLLDLTCFTRFNSRSASRKHIVFCGMGFSRWAREKQNQLAAQFVLGHELGHVANGDRTDEDRMALCDSTQECEKQADYFAAKKLSGLPGVSELDVVRAVEKWCTWVGEACVRPASGNHPNLQERLATVTQGFEEGSGERIELHVDRIDSEGAIRIGSERGRIRGKLRSAKGLSLLLKVGHEPEQLLFLESDGRFSFPLTVNQGHQGVELVLRTALERNLVLQKSIRVTLDQAKPELKPKATEGSIEPGSSECDTLLLSTKWVDFEVEDSDDEIQVTIDGKKVEPLTGTASTYRIPESVLAKPLFVVRLADRAANESEYVLCPKMIPPPELQAPTGLLCTSGENVSTRIGISRGVVKSVESTIGSCAVIAQEIHCKVARPRSGNMPLDVSVSAVDVFGRKAPARFNIAFDSSPPQITADPVACESAGEWRLRVEDQFLRTVRINGVEQSGEPYRLRADTRAPIAVSADDCSGNVTTKSLSCRCPGDLIPDASGDCVCPSGASRNADRCLCPGQLILSPGGCFCPSGSSPSVDDVSVCVCSGGRVFRGGTCSCPRGSLPFDGGNCACPNGMLVRNGECACPAFASPRRNVCECPPRTVLAGDACVCRPGLLGTAPDCSCPLTQQYNSQKGVCECRGSTVWDGNRCSCPGELVDTGNGVCSCPGSTVRIGNTHACGCQSPRVRVGNQCGFPPGFGLGCQCWQFAPVGAQTVVECASGFSGWFPGCPTYFPCRLGMPFTATCL